MHLGITGVHIRRVSLVGAALATIIGVVGYAAGRAYGTVNSNRQVFLLIAGAAAVGAILPLAVFLASVLRIELVEREVRQTLFGRWIVTSQSLTDLVSIHAGGRAFPLVLTFRDGSHMRVLGAHMRDVPDFVHRLQAKAPQAQIGA